MNGPDVREKVLAILAGLAPEVDMNALKPGLRLRDQVDLDSMDFLNFLIGIDEQLSVDIPEADYPRLNSLDEIYRYLAERLAAAEPPPA
jgi:acyl carrier protein